MTVTNALVPIETFPPSPINMDGTGVSLNHNPGRSREEILLRVYTPHVVEEIYGSEGEEIVNLKRGELIDIYV